MDIKKIFVEKSLKNITATLAFERLKSSDLALDMSRMILEEKISGLEAREVIFNHYNIKSKPKV